MITIRSVELDEGPQGFPWVLYDVLDHESPVWAERLEPNDTLDWLEAYGFTRNRARRILLEARERGLLKVELHRG